MATTGQEDNIAEESTLAILPVCCFGFLKISLLSPTCWLGRRNNDEVHGGDDDQRTRGQHHRRTYVGYTTCLLLLFFLVVISLVSHMLAMAEG